MDEDAALAQKLATLLPQLDERQRRLLLGAEARALGRGGITRVARVAGVSQPTVERGLAELDAPAPAGLAGLAPPARGQGGRQPGGGRPPQDGRDPALLAALEARVNPDTRLVQMS